MIRKRFELRDDFHVHEERGRAFPSKCDRSIRALISAGDVR